MACFPCPVITFTFHTSDYEGNPDNREPEWNPGIGKWPGTGVLLGLSARRKPQHYRLPAVVQLPRGNTDNIRCCGGHLLPARCLLRLQEAVLAQGVDSAVHRGEELNGPKPTLPGQWRCPMGGVGHALNARGWAHHGALPPCHPTCADPLHLVSVPGWRLLRHYAVFASPMESVARMGGRSWWCGGADCRAAGGRHSLQCEVWNLSRGERAARALARPCRL